MKAFHLSQQWDAKLIRCCMLFYLYLHFCLGKEWYEDEKRIFFSALIFDDVLILKPKIDWLSFVMKISICGPRNLSLQSVKSIWRICFTVCFKFSDLAGFLIGDFPRRLQLFENKSKQKRNGRKSWQNHTVRKRILFPRSMSPELMIFHNCDFVRSSTDELMFLIWCTIWLWHPNIGK